MCSKLLPPSRSAVRPSTRTADSHLHPRLHAQRNPTKPAIVLAGSGQCVTYAELAERSNRAGNLLRHLGLSRGDSVAFCIENDPRLLEICLAAHNNGLYYTPVSWRL